ncbi:MAG: peptidylprolyl isomerase [Bacteroidota bacterium]
MLNLFRIWLVLGLAGTMVIGCKGTKEASNPKTSPALLTFAEGTVTQAEFERVYAKNNGGQESASQHTPEQLREYLDLYINFKRKVFEAEAEGIDKTPGFQQEFNTYKAQLVKPYMAATEVKDRLVQEAYDRSGYKVDASHILLMVDENANPSDTLAAYQKIMGLRDSVLTHGKAFEEMAEYYSEDPSAQSNGGRLGYFSVFEMVYPFETAAYSTEPGSVSMPARTRFGYHILKVHDKIKNEGTKRAAHIIVRIGDRYGAKDEAQAEQIIKEISQKLKDGADWNAMVQQYSDDPSSANKGGDLGTGRLLPEMEAWKLKLGENEISEPFKTRFGQHLMKITQVSKVPTFEESKSQLEQKISRDSRSQLSRKALIARIKQESQYSLQQENFDAFKASLTDEFSVGTWNPDTNQQALYNKALFTLADGYSRSIQDFITDYKSKRLRRPGVTADQAANAFVDSYVEQQLLAYEEEQLPNKNPEFRYLLQEYRDGILLFTLMEQKVWKKAVEDTTGLKTYYEAHQDSFFKKETVDVKEYRTTTEATIQQVEALLKEGKSESTIDSLVNRNTAIALRTIIQTYEKGEKGIPSALFSEDVGYQSDIIGQENFYRIMVSLEKFPSGVAPLDKVKSEAITLYQDYLEKTWLAELAEKYPVKIDEDVFAKIFK